MYGVDLTRTTHPDQYIVVIVTYILSICIRLQIYVLHAVSDIRLVSIPLPFTNHIYIIALEALDLITPLFDHYGAFQTLFVRLVSTLERNQHL